MLLHADQPGVPPSPAAPVQLPAAGGLVALAGDRFAVSDALGEMLPGTRHGFYAADTRFLSTYTLRLNGARLAPLTARNVDHHAASFYATGPTWSELEPGAVSVLRDRYVDDVLRDELTLTNHTGRPVDLELSLGFAADFLDIFEVRSPHPRGPVAPPELVAAGSRLVFRTRNGGLVQRTSIALSRRPQLEGGTAVYRLRLRPHQEWRLGVEVRAVQTQRRRLRHLVALPAARPRGAPAPAADREREAPRPGPTLRTDDVDLRLAFERAVADLRALELVTADGHRLLAAGLPWYVAVFGRDALLAAYQSLLLDPQQAADTLRALAALQATEHDDFRDAEPGKIPHEVRNGRLARLGHVPHARYYGTVDATPLWLILLGETVRWTGDLGLARELLPAAEAALAWIDTFGDRDGDGFVEYARRSPEGLANQGWKDSWDGVRFADGRRAEGSIALCEVQGYVFDAKRRMAELFEQLGQSERAARLRAEAARLKADFDAAFWLPQEGTYALALDGRKRPVDSVTSNPGHALWSGIVDDGRVARVAERLMAPDLFSGWGVRTLSSAMAAYNPVSYHNGSVWPHDTALVAAGLARYGFASQAVRLLRGLLEASAGFPQHRLPELFAGYPRRPGGFPVEYPAANAPQAWAAASVVLALQTLLGIRPDAGRLVAEPLPGAPRVHLARVPFRGRRLTLPASARRRGGPTPQERPA